jgi:hypothetical protein
LEGNNVKTQIKVDLLAEIIVNAMDAADIGYWASVPKGADHYAVLAGKESAIVKEREGPHDGHGNGRHELTGAKIRQGLQVMAEKYPHHFSNVVENNADAETGDVLIQCALFGDIIYG